VRLGLRWIVEATNTWWSNYGQLRRNTDRRSRHCHAALCLATVVLIVGKLIACATAGAPAERLSAQVLSPEHPSELVQHLSELGQAGANRAGVALTSACSVASSR
jgi:hypothetical protein